MPLPGSPLFAPLECGGSASAFTALNSTSACSLSTQRATTAEAPEARNMLAQRACPERSRRVSAGFNARQAPEVRQISLLHFCQERPRHNPSRIMPRRLAQISLFQKTIPSRPTPRTIKSCASATTLSSRASVPPWSFFAFLRRLSAPRAALFLPASR
jgi:hypothetical protein